MQLILDTRGITVHKRNGCFHLHTEAREKLIAPQKVGSILVAAQCMLTSSAIRLAVDNQIPIYFIDAFGRVQAQLWSASFGKLADLRRNQVLFVDSQAASQWAVKLFLCKIEQQQKLIAWLGNRKPSLEKQVNDCQELFGSQSEKMKKLGKAPLAEITASLMGLEGIAAREYWDVLAASMPDGYHFEGRSRRPALDPFNATINYLYGILYTNVETAIFSVGLDPYLGILHADQYDKPTLSYDLIEPFRTWADRVALESFIGNRTEPDFFEMKNDGYALSKNGKRYFIPLFNTYLNTMGMFRGTKTKRKNHIYRFAGSLVEELQKIS